MKRLKWEGLPGFNKVKWTPLYDPSHAGVTGAFYKTYKNFAFYWILKAGHMVRYWRLFTCPGVKPEVESATLVSHSPNLNADSAEKGP